MEQTPAALDLSKMSKICDTVATSLDIQKTPKKKLVVRGSASSPWDTDFEWVEEKGEETNRTPGSEEEDRPLKNKDFLEEIKNVFHET